MQNRIFRKVCEAFILVIVASFLAGPFEAFADGAFLTFNVFSGHPGSTITASGGGFSGNESISVYFGSASGTPAGTATADSVGSFSASLTIPASSQQGNLEILAVGKTSGKQAMNTFYVQNFLPSITAQSTSNLPGSSIAISGKDFAPGEMINIALSSSSATVTANSAGAFTGATLTAPNVAPDTYKITATGQSSNAQAIAYFYIGAFYPSAWPSSFYLLPQQTLTFSGNSFAPGETVDVIDKTTGGPSITFSADSMGAFTNMGAIDIPFSYSGTKHTYVLQGETSKGTSSEISVSFGKLNAQAKPSDYFIMPNNIEYFSVTGFASKELVQVFADNQTQVSSSAMTDQWGNFYFQAPVTVPYGFAGGTHTYHLIGQTSGAESDVKIQVGQLYPQLAPSSYFVKPKQQITIYGWNFAPDENVTFTMQGSTQTSTATSDVKGNVKSDPFTIPFTDQKTLTITATGEISGTTATLAISIAKFEPWASADNYYIQPGSTVSFTGQDFAPNEIVIVSTNGQTVETLHTDSNGSITSNSYTVPFGLPSKVTYTLTGAESNASANVTISISSFSPWASADNYYVMPGSAVLVQGHGFAPNEMVNIQAGSFTTSVAASAKGDTDPVAVTVPFGTKDSLKIILTGKLSGASTNLAVSISTFAPYVTASSYYVQSGSSISFSGKGFAPTETVNFGDSLGLNGSTNADLSGAISAQNILAPKTSGDVTYTFAGVESQTPVNVTITVH